jgi:integrase
VAKDLTKAALDNLKPGAKRREVPDGHTRGLYFVLQPSGASSWALRYRIDGHNTKWTIGPYPEIDLKPARVLARKGLAKIAAGGNPAAEKKTARTAARAPAQDLIEVVGEQHIKRHIRATLKPSSAREQERLVRKEIIGPWRGRRMADISPRDIYKRLDAILDRGSPIAANRARSAMNTFFDWARSRDIVTSNPCDRVRAPAAEVVRDRVLDDGELKAVWAKAEALGAPFGSVLQLLLLTGQRLGEVAGMRWSELDLAARLWRLPKERTKNGRAHTVPLSSQALAIIEAMPRIAGSDFVFTTNGRVPVDGFSRIKRILDARLPADMPAWRLHDIRRSTATGLARIGVDIVVVERLLNHASGAFRGIVGTYQRHGFDDERRIALDRWGRHVEATSRGEAASNVVEIAAAARR